MLNELAHARHLAQLGFLQTIVEEAGLPATMLEKSEMLPIHILMAGFSQDGKGRDRFLHFSFLPLDDDELAAVQLLQLYVTFPFELPQERRADMAQLLLDFNTRLPLGHFGVNEQNEIHYRYIYSLPASATFDKDETLSVIELFVQMCDLFGDAIEAVADGSLSWSEAINPVAN